MVEITRHFTVSAYIIYDNKVLLHRHKKLDILLPPGGHIERDELPVEAILREIKEEAGVEVELCNSNKEYDFLDSTELNRGEHLNLHNINEFHQHMDFVFYAKAKSSQLNPEEDTKMNWYSREDIEKSNNIKDIVKIYALEALEKLKE
mgnify:FL=1